MSAASVRPPMITSYIQAPSRFLTPEKEKRVRNASGIGEMKTAYHKTGVAPASYYKGTSQYGVHLEEGQVPRIVDSEPNPISLNTWKNPYTEQAAALYENAADKYIHVLQPKLSTKGRRINPNSATSAGFPLAVTPQQAAENAARKAAAQAAWEREQNEIFERSKQEHIEEQARRQAEKAEAEARIYRTSSPLALTKLAHNRSASQLPALTKEETAQLYARQVRDTKIPFRERIVPPKPDFDEDPLTAQATEHTGLYPGPVHRGEPFVPTGIVDDEAVAPEGSKERELQKLRVNPLLDPNFQGLMDAAGLGYGRKHPNHFKYVSHWSTPEMHKMSYELSQNSKEMSGYRSKSGYGYRSEVKSMGYGFEHPLYKKYISVRRAEDVLKDYPNREACEKFFNRTK